ncbi:serine hydrolase domain-containing protein [Kribbella sp. CA-247076]|uniref:serine hydrolase domain-containing protein n=1 Tax=Kribbella sp. CA-247076 TaxID=3239941 RepID=UPI003D8D3AB3
MTAATVPGAAAADSTAVSKVGERPELQRAMQEFVGAGFGGLQLRVRDERGDWVGSAGVRKLGGSAKPPTNGRFWIGSTTKTFTATVVLQLVAEGKVGLDAPVAGYLPELGLDRRITVRMLLQHTSGLFNYTGDFDADGNWEPGVVAGGKDWVDDRFHSYRPDQLVRLALSRAPRFAPGTDQRYANTNYTLALLLIERSTGRSYADELQRRILRPLRLDGTSVPGNRSRLPGPHAHGYYRYQDAGEWKLADVSRQNLTLLAGAGDMASTTKELQTFIAALMGGRLLPAALLDEMRTPVGPYNLGLGLWVQDLGPDCGGIVYQHNGGAPGGYGAMMYSSADGRRTLTASVTTADAPIDPAVVFPAASDKLVKDVFCAQPRKAAR